MWDPLLAGSIVVGLVVFAILCVSLQKDAAAAAAAAKVKATAVAEDKARRITLLKQAVCDFHAAHPLAADQHGYRMQYNGEVPKEHPQWILYPQWLESYREQLQLEWTASVWYAKI